MLIIKERLTFNLNEMFIEKYCQMVLSRLQTMEMDLNLSFEDLKKIVNEAFDLHWKKGVSVNTAIAKSLYKLHNVNCERADFWNYKMYMFEAVQLYRPEDVFMIGNGYYEGNNTCMGASGSRRNGYLDFLARGGMVFALKVVNRNNEEVSLGRLLVMPYYCGLPNERLKSLDELKIENMIFLATNVYLNKLQNILPAEIESLDYRIAVAKMFLKALKEYLKMKYDINFVFVISNKLLGKLKRLLNDDFYWNGDDVVIMSKKFDDIEFGHFTEKLKFLSEKGYVILPVTEFFWKQNVKLEEQSVAERLKDIMKLNGIEIETEVVMENQMENGNEV